ncbi:hypothetical protein [Yersinia intermedia]|uniref:hypothetical protein n=1 Tax=Yersinia intermedia TaxID=631 RepID=UPI0030CEE02C
MSKNKMVLQGTVKAGTTGSTSRSEEKTIEAEMIAIDDSRPIGQAERWLYSSPLNSFGMM